jgi:RecA-family ATPase
MNEKPEHPGINVVRFARKAEERKIQPLDSMSCAELLAKEFPQQRWIIPGLLPAGSTLLAGAPKTGKSWMMMDWCAAIASGGAVFGQIPVEPGHVEYLALEDGFARLQSRLRQTMRGGPLPYFASFAVLACRIGAGLVEQIHDIMAKRPHTRLIMIDTMARITPQEQKRGNNSYQNDYLIGEAMTPLAAQYNIAIVCIHHAKKGQSADPLELVSGTHGLAGSFDNVFVLTRNRAEKTAVLYVTGRDIEDERDIELEWDQRLVMWRMVYQGAGVGMATDTRKVFLAIRDRPDGLSPAEVLEATGLDEFTAIRCLGELRSDGVVAIADGRIVPVRPGV